MSAPLRAAEGLPEGHEWMVIRCTERPRQASIAHIISVGTEVGLCGRQPWKKSMYVEVIYRHPDKQCLVCAEKARSLM